MANNFGLYINNATERLLRSDYPIDDSYDEPGEDDVNDDNIGSNYVWVRNALNFNGNVVTKTAIEHNKLGIYAKDKELLLNGSNIADSADVSTIRSFCNSATFGEAILNRPLGVINITKEDYCSLRCGNKVEGYARYDEKAVYRIVDTREEAEEANAANNIEFSIPEGSEDLYDFIYNSYINNWEDNIIDNHTYTDPNTPELAIRHADCYGVKGEGINIEYFVDTKGYDSINNGIIDDTFTVIVEDSYGNVIYKHTTFAGQFKIKTDRFVDEQGHDIVGETWFTIRCIDKHGRGSCEWSFTVLLRDTNYEEELYEMQLSDLTYYGITIATDENKDDPVIAYRNRCGFSRLIHDVRNGLKDTNNKHYNGIKFFNPNANSDFDSSDNNAYYISLYSDLEHAVDDRDLSNYTYKSRLASAFVFSSQDYYILKYNAGSSSVAPTLDSILYKNPNDGENDDYREATIPEEKVTDWTLLTKEDIEPFKLVPGKKFLINGVEYTVGNDVLDWISEDGAHICRDANDFIQRNASISFDYRPATEVLLSGWQNIQNKFGLRTINFNLYNTKKTGILSNKGSYKEQRSRGPASGDGSDPYFYYPFKQGAGYYYSYWYNGLIFRDGNKSYPAKDGEDVIGKLDNFIIDFNYTSWRHYDNAANLNTSRTQLLDLAMAYDVQVRNGWIKGGFEPTNQLFSRKLCLMHSAKLYAPWEGAALFGVESSKFCIFDNMKITNSMGYDGVMHAAGSVGGYVTGENETGDSYHKCNFNSAGYIDVSNSNKRGLLVGNTLADNSAIVRDDKGTSLLPEDSYERVDESITDICLTTSDFLDLSKIYKKVRRKAFIPDTSASAYTTYTDAIYLTRDLDSRAGGKYPEAFISFYKQETVEGRTSYTYLKTVKTQTSRRVKIPRGATHIKVTMYSIGTIQNNRPVLYMTETGPIASSNYSVYNETPSENIKLLNCTFEDSQSSQVHLTAINLTIENCTFRRMGYYAHRVNVADASVYPLGSEEQGCVQMLLEVNNCKIERTIGDTINDLRTSRLQVRFARQGTCATFRNCTGFSIVGRLHNAYIDKCYLWGTTCDKGRRFIAHSETIMRNSKMCKPVGWSIALTYSTEYLNKLKANSFYYSRCEEEVNRNFSIEGCFINKPVIKRLKYLLKGRMFHCAETPVDKRYINTNIINNLWARRGNYNEGWVNIILIAETDGHILTVGTGTTFSSHCYKENNELVVMIDGERAYGAFQGSGKIKIPTAGYHLVSYKLIPKVQEKANGIICLPGGVLVTEFPNIIGQLNGEDFYFNQIFPTIDGKEAYPYVMGEKKNPCGSLVSRCINGYKLSGKGGQYDFEVYVPKGSVDSYKSHVGWADAEMIEGQEIDLNRLI